MKAIINNPVYLVYHEYNNGNDLEHIYSTFEKAEDYVKKDKDYFAKTKHPYLKHYYITKKGAHSKNYSITSGNVL